MDAPRVAEKCQLATVDHRYVLEASKMESRRAKSGRRSIWFCRFRQTPVASDAPPI